MFWWVRTSLTICRQWASPKSHLYRLDSVSLCSVNQTVSEAAFLLCEGFSLTSENKVRIRRKILCPLIPVDRHFVLPIRLKQKSDASFFFLKSIGSTKHKRTKTSKSMYARKYAHTHAYIDTHMCWSRWYGSTTGLRLCCAFNQDALSYNNWFSCSRSEIKGEKLKGADYKQYANNIQLCLRKLWHGYFCMFKQDH